MAMNSAYQSSGKIFEQVSMKTNPGLLEQLRSVKEDELLVVRGQYDHIEKLLDTLKVPYTTLDSHEIEKHNGGRVMFVNCKSYDSGAPVKAVQTFVESGGRLVTTDWALGLVTKSFPGKLYKTKETADDVVEIMCETDLARNFMGMNYAQCHPKWWLEGSSYIFKTEPGVIDLITSQDMKAKYGQEHVAVAFPQGSGEVFHFISHLELQKTKQTSASDKGSLEDFLKKMGASKTIDMEDATVAELEAAYSTLNTLAYLCSRTPLINTGNNSVLVNAMSGAAKSKKLV